jgi:hypothetical protein
VVVVLGPHVLHLVDAATLGASLHRALAGHLEHGTTLVIFIVLPCWGTYAEPDNDV